MALNLHKIVRSSITLNHPDEKLLHIRSTGQTESDDEGKVSPKYKEEEVLGQVQSEGDASLFHANMANQNAIVRRIYLYSSSSALTQPSGIFRPLARNGDLFRREDGTWWLVVAVEDNFSDVGWVSVRVVLQENPPEGYEDASQCACCCQYD